MENLHWIGGGTVWARDDAGLTQFGLMRAQHGNDILDQVVV
jgi:hypothetical protein